MMSKVIHAEDRFKKVMSNHVARTMLHGCRIPSFQSSLAKWKMERMLSPERRIVDFPDKWVTSPRDILGLGLLWEEMSVKVDE